MELLTTSHGKPCAHYKGYSHIIKRSLLDGTVVWRCSKQRSKQCRGMLKTRDTNVLTSNDHNCGPPDDARLEVQKAVTKAKKRAREEDTPISKVYSEELGDLHNRGYNFVMGMPEQQVTKRTLYNQRAKSQGNQKEPKLSQEMSLQAEELTMSDGTSFLLSDDESAERIIIFCGKSGTEVLKSKQDFFMDGTFKSCKTEMSTDDVHPSDDCSSSHHASIEKIKNEDDSLSPLDSHSTVRCRWALCGEWFSSLNDLANHVSHTHAVAACEGLFYCGWEGCSRPHKGFNARYKMLVHVRTHTNEKPHQCSECNKSFSRAENLKIHARSHTGEKPYTCPVPGCHKAYSNSSDRFKHTRTHSIEKPYICKVPGCNKRYTDPSSLRKHAKTYSHFITPQQASMDKFNTGKIFKNDIFNMPQANCNLEECFNTKIKYKTDFNYDNDHCREESDPMIIGEEEEQKLQLDCVTTQISTSWLQSLYPRRVLSWNKLEEQDVPLDLTVHPSSHH